MRTVLAIVGPTATGKSALAIEVALRRKGEIINCDSTAVYRGLDIGTDKVPVAEQRGVPHHLVDVVGADQVYTAAQYARDAEALIRDIHARGRLPILVGGTGLYYRALVHGLFPGPGADDALRMRLDAVAARRGPERLHRWLQRVDRESAIRIMPRDQKRLVRALEVYLTTGIPLTQHFARTVSPIADCTVLTVGLRLPAALTSSRVTARVETQFARGVVAEVEDLLAAGLSPSARSLGGLVYRQIMELRAGVRDEAETRALIAQENRRYARRQLIWFRKEPNLVWLDGPGDRPEVRHEVETLLDRVGVAGHGETSNGAGN